VYHYELKGLNKLRITSLRFAYQSVGHCFSETETELPNDSRAYTQREWNATLARGEGFSVYFVLSLCVTACRHHLTERSAVSTPQNMK
jgi:hypothetical protein